MQRIERITDQDGNLLAVTTQREPSRCQRRGYTGILQSPPEDTAECCYWGEMIGRDVGGNETSREYWQQWIDIPLSLCRVVYGIARLKRDEEHCEPDPEPYDPAPSALPLPEDDLVSELISDIRRRCWRFGLQHFPDMVQEVFALVWDAMSSDSPPEWFSLDDYQGTLTRAIRQARHRVIVRSVPYPEHTVARMEAKEQAKVPDEPAEQLRDWLTALLPELPEREASYLAFVGDRSPDANLLAELLDVSERTAYRRSSSAKTAVILAALIESLRLDSVQNFEDCQ